jgi:hypothetical protein
MIIEKPRFEKPRLILFLHESERHRESLPCDTIGDGSSLSSEDKRTSHLEYRQFSNPTSSIKGFPVKIIPTSWGVAEKAMNVASDVGRKFDSGEAVPVRS